MIKEIARQIYEELKKENGTIKAILKEIEKEKTAKLHMTKTPFLNSIGNEFGKLLLREEEKFEMLLKLWKIGKRDERLIVIAALGRISEHDYEWTKKFVLGILEDISDWEICDQLALKVMVNLATKNQEEMFSMMEKWIKAENKWIRRLAIATIPPYIRARPQNAEMCLEFLNDAMQDEDKDVKKAIGWALREISKKDSKAVFEFLMKWAKVENMRWIVKEGMKKLPKEEKEKLVALMG